MPAADPLMSNIAEFSVFELSTALKLTLEDVFGHVRVRGEISGFKRAASGHCYFCLKDDRALLDAVCWRGTSARFGFLPEDGLEVVATGRITTYPGRSKYQLVVEQLEPAGAGALMALLEERKTRLAAEGLFDRALKRPLPYLPEVIGVVTSPTGAVIRDILHRISERFPVHVLLWPVLVQGDQAAQQVAAAIDGFNTITGQDGLPRPDVLIVARGGGALEDLWAFNEECVVRAARRSVIPLIAAIGHETDTTLIDLAADCRAPTPTAAAELAVPVRAELAVRNAELAGRLLAAIDRRVSDRAQTVKGLGRGLPDPMSLLGQASQRLDDLTERLPHGLRSRVWAAGALFHAAKARLGQPTRLLTEAALRLKLPADQLTRLFGRRLIDCERTLHQAHARLSLAEVARRLPRHDADLAGLGARQDHALRRRLDQAAARLLHLQSLLGSYSHNNVLSRGFVLVRDERGQLMRSVAQARDASVLELEFADGRLQALPVKERGAAGRRPARPAPPGDQGRLL